MPWPVLNNCIFPMLFLLAAALLAFFAADNLLSNSIFGVPSIGLGIVLICFALFAIFRSHFNDSVNDVLVWISIVISGFALIAFFAFLHRSEGLLCTAPVCTSQLAVAVDDPRFATRLGERHRADWAVPSKDASTTYVDTGLNSALYYSTVTFTTLGYGDFQPSPRLRLIAGLEALIGYAYLGMVIGLLIDLGNRRNGDGGISRKPQLAPEQEGQAQTGPTKPR